MKLREVPTPSPEENEVLVKVRASSVNAYDWHMLRGTPRFMRLTSGLTKPKITVLGADVAGVVETVGSAVNQFNVGDEVYGLTASCPTGSFAEYVVVSARQIAPKPPSMSFEEAAAVPLAAITALQGLRDKGGIRSEQNVLIHGASGGVGTYAVQIAKAFDTEVTGVCSTRNVELVQSLGADHVIDYTKDDFVLNKGRYDLVLVVNGKRSILDYRRVLKPAGTAIMAGGEMSQLYQFVLLNPFLSIGSKKNMSFFVAQPKQEDLVFIAELIESEKVRSVIDRTYSLSEVPDAIRYMENERTRGKVIITV